MSKTCAKCHTPDGIAVAEQHAKFELVTQEYPNFVDTNLANLETVVKTQYNGTSELLLKPIGQLSHGGQVVIQKDGPEYKVLEELVQRIQSGDPCPTGDASNSALAGVQMLDASATFRKASIDIAGRLPTENENAIVLQGGEGVLDAGFDHLMQEETFYVRLKEIFNDLILTDKFAGGGAIDFMNETDFPAVKPFRDPKNAAYNGDVRNKINFAIGREPLNLITYVVRNERPFTEVLSANYALVNPYSAIAYGVTKQVQFTNPYNENELHEAHVVTAVGTAIPHAGILSTPTWMERWQTTPTNRNRARARRVLKYFLDTDILRLGTRPIDATKVTNLENPTHNSPLCNVCHRVIDPIAGTFRGFDDADYPHFDPAKPWHDEMFPPGFAGVDMPAANYGNAVQWLGQQVVQDPRFLISTVHTIYTGFTGHEPIAYPMDNTAPDFDAKLAAWQAQDAFFRAAADGFQKSNYNLKTIVKAVLKSPYYRGASIQGDAPANAQALFQDIGTARLLTPEMLNRKIIATTGVPWRKTYEYDRSHNWLEEDYHILYGGMDSDAVPTRLKEPNSIMASVAGRMANEVSCKLTAWDFTKTDKAQRVLFPLIDLTETPESAGHTVDGAVANIRINIQYLHKRLLGESLALNDPEIDRTYQVFLDTWHELSMANNTDIPYDCQGNWDITTGKDLPDKQKLQKDEHFTIRAWMAVTTYLLSDYKFLFE